MSIKQLRIIDLLLRAKDYFPEKEIVSVETKGIFRYNYEKLYGRVTQAANLLKYLNLTKGDVVGTLAFNNYRHLELYFAVPCYGAILHTINIRLSDDQLVHVINHAQNKALFFDPSMLPIIKRIYHRLDSVKYFIILCGDEIDERNELTNFYTYESIMTFQKPDYNFPELAETEIAALCYTTATTGNPKGVAYSHRSIVLHCWATAMADTLAVSEKDTILPFVPMFHVNAWGLPYSAALVGAKLVLTGDVMTPKVICELVENEGVTLTAGVPTILRMIIEELERSDYDFSKLRMIVSGGAPLTEDLLIAYQRKLNITISQAYGMTETAPMVSFCKPLSKMSFWSEKDKNKIMLKQGQLVPGLQMRIVDEKGNVIYKNVGVIGELQLKGLWVTDAYYNEPELTKDKFAEDGWLRTQDIVSVDKDGYIKIVDRAQDLIKSGGEWISSADLEGEILKHHCVREACIISINHEKWDERPLAFVVLKESVKAVCIDEKEHNVLDENKCKIIENDIRRHLMKKFAKFWIPDSFIFIEAIPKTSVGKANKKLLREQYLDELKSKINILD